MSTPVTQRVAISFLREECNKQIKAINTGEGTQTPGFQSINRLLKACDAVFAADDARSEARYERVLIAIAAMPRGGIIRGGTIESDRDFAIGEAREALRSVHGAQWAHLVNRYKRAHP